MRAAVVVLFLLLANALLASEEKATPGTPAAQLFQKWLTAYNAADGAALRSFVEQHYTPEARSGRSAAEIAEGQMEGRQATQGFEVVEISTASASELDAVLKSRGTFTRYLRLSLKLNSAEPPLIAERKVTNIPPPAGAQPQRDAAAVARELDQKLTELTAKDEFSGVAMIAQGDKPLWQKAYGLQDREKKIPVELGTRFRLGSMPKMFTSVAIAQLVEQGKFKFEDTLAEVLPDYPNKEAAEKIRVHHLLTHSSGLRDIFNAQFQKRKDELRTLADYLPLFVDQPLRFEPGKGRSYSNAAFIVLGLIIEKHSGLSYYDYLQKHVFEPAGMSATGNTPKTERVSNLAVGYTNFGTGKLRPNWEMLPYRGMAAGGGESNLADLLRFAHALRSYKLLSKEMTERITSGKPGDAGGPPTPYGYGFADRRSGEHRVVGHNGGAPGMNGDLSILWEQGYTVVVLANRDPSVAEDAAQFAVDRL